MITVSKKKLIRLITKVDFFSSLTLSILHYHTFLKFCWFSFLRRVWMIWIFFAGLCFFIIQWNLHYNANLYMHFYIVYLCTCSWQWIFDRSLKKLLFHRWVKPAYFFFLDFPCIHPPLPYWPLFHGSISLPCHFHLTMPSLSFVGTSDQLHQMMTEEPNGDTVMGNHFII